MLRPYQLEAISQVRREYLSGKKKALLWLPTGSGKSVIACEMIRQAVKRGKKCIFIVRGVSLIEQISRRLFAEGIEHGVVQAGHWNKNLRASVQVLSIDTIARRKIHIPADFIVIDEADHAVSRSYINFVASHPNAYFLSITATPFSFKPLTHVADCLVHPITVGELTDQGYLSKLRYFAPSTPNLAGVKVDAKTHDYALSQLAERMATNHLTGDILSHWQKLGKGRPTLCFAVNVAHSKSLTQMFNDNNVRTEHIEASTPIKYREEVFERLKNGETKILCNVGIATRGLDLPFVSCLIMARPTKSYNLYIQMLGRGTRACTGKDSCLVLDHAGNTKRHGFMIHEPPVDLENPKEIKSRITVRICKVCFLAFQGNACPDCGKPIDEVMKDYSVELKEGELKEIQATETNEILVYKAQCEKIKKEKKYKPGWVYHRMLDKFGEERAAPYIPRWFFARKWEK